MNLSTEIQTVPYKRDRSLMSIQFFDNPTSTRVNVGGNNPGNVSDNRFFISPKNCSTI